MSKLYVEPQETERGKISFLVRYGDRQYEIHRILADGRRNAKMAKLVDETEVISVGLSLAPDKTSGVTDVCEYSTPGCRLGCLHFKGRADMGSGRTVSQKIRLGRMARTAAFFRYPHEFGRMVESELELAHNRAHKQGKLLAFRPDVFSDVDWAFWYPQWFKDKPLLRAYGYTKNPVKYRKFLNGDSRIHLTFSRSEKNERQCLEFLHQGGSVAVVFKDKIPDRWKTFPVIDGTQHDLRFIDPQNVVVGLKFKPKRGSDRQGEIDRMVKNGFVIDSLAESQMKGALFV